VATASAQHRDQFLPETMSTEQIEIEVDAVVGVHEQLTDRGGQSVAGNLLYRDAVVR
jgi:hypothetical protein